MNRLGLFGLVFSSLLVLGAPLAQADVPPGTPLSGGGGTTDIVTGLSILPGLVQPGDVVMRENPLGGDGRGNWSDVVRFFNMTLGGTTTGYAFMIPDGEAGIPDISVLRTDVVNNVAAPDATLLTDSLSAINQIIDEIQTGTGTDADITPYSVPYALYNFHSDAAVNEGPEEPPIIMPGGPIGIGKRNRAVFLSEDGCLANNNVFTVDFLLQGGPMPDPPPGPGWDGGSDPTFFAPNPITGQTTISWSSDVGDPGGGADFETYEAMGDECVMSLSFYGDEIPEPATLSLLAVGALALMSGRQR